MRNLIIVSVTAILVPTLVNAQEASPISEMKYPNRYAYELLSLREAPPVFECNYTSRSCLRGFRRGADFAGEVLAEDRKTVIAHITCYAGRCTNYDTGVIKHGSITDALKGPDMPRSCVEARYERRELCAKYAP